MAATDWKDRRFSYVMAVVAMHRESSREMWSSAIGCLLGKTAYPVDGRTPSELKALLKKLG
jgi:hypothetical protein